MMAPPMWHVRPEPTDVVVVLVRVHQEPDRLVRCEACDLVDDGQATPLVQGSFHDR